MRKRFKRSAICSSDNYRVSRKAHIEYLKEKHLSFCGIAVSGKIAANTPVVNETAFTPKYKTIRVFGKEMVLTIEEYNLHCKHLGL